MFWFYIYRFHFDGFCFVWAIFQTRKTSNLLWSNIWWSVFRSKFICLSAFLTSSWAQLFMGQSIHRLVIFTACSIANCFVTNFANIIVFKWSKFRFIKVLNSSSWKFSICYEHAISSLQFEFIWAFMFLCFVFATKLTGRIIYLFKQLLFRRIYFHFGFFININSTN